MLPKLTPDPKSPGRLTGAVSYGGRMVKLSMVADGSTAERLMAFTSGAVDALAELDSMARQVAAKHLLSEYNLSWRRFSRVGPDGRALEMAEPELADHDFIARLTLASLEVVGDSCLTLGYSDDQMFAGHSVLVTSFGGLQFTDAHAELFG